MVQMDKKYMVHFQERKDLSRQAIIASTIKEEEQNIKKKIVMLQKMLF